VRVVVIGANGQLGTDVRAAYESAGHDVVALSHAEIEIRDRAAVHRSLTAARPDVVVNTAAMHNVDACESDPESAMAVNATGPHNLALSGRDLGFLLMHVSTDYVFDGEKRAPYVETDLTRPVNAYGRSKVRGEQLVAETLPAHFVVRTSGLFGHAACRAKPSGNFVQVMLRAARDTGEVRVVADEIVTPTFTQDLARQMVRLSETSAYGVYHATSQGETSWFEYARTIFELADLPVTMHVAKTSDFPRKTPRPSYSVLDNAALRTAGLDIMPHWRDSLARYLGGSGHV